jgi:hypothetical protein
MAARSRGRRRQIRIGTCIRKRGEGGGRIPKGNAGRSLESIAGSLFPLPLECEKGERIRHVGYSPNVQRRPRSGVAVRDHFGHIDEPRQGKGRGESTNPFFSCSSDVDGVDRSCKSLASALWYHAAIQCGHQAAQVSLADKIMRCYYTKKEKEDEEDDAESSSDDRLCPRSSREDALLAASVLFTMAHDQGHANSRESLRRLMDMEMNRLIGGYGECDVEGNDLFASPVMQILLMTA